MDNDDRKIAVTGAENALDANDPEQAMALLSPYFQELSPREMWLVGRVLTKMGDPTQALALYKQAFERDPALPFIDVRLGETSFQIRDVEGSRSLLDFADELYHDIYGLQNLALEPGDTFIDVGANIGFVSLYVAKTYPEVRVLSFEPAPETFSVLQENIARNDVTNIIAISKAVSGDGRDLDLLITPGDSGASNAFCSDEVVARLTQNMDSQLVSVLGTTLDDVFAEYQIERCAALKLDCEGAEYEILRTTEMLERIDRIDMELHIPVSKIEKEGMVTVRDGFVKEISERVGSPPHIHIATTVGVMET